MIKQILLIICLAMIQPVMAQTYSFDRHIGIENGLSNNFVQDIAIDKRGAVWIGTEAGVSVVSGHSVTVFNSRSQTDSRGSIVGNEVRSLHYDKTADKMIIATDKGLSIYDCAKARFHSITREQGLADIIINDIAQASDSTVWLVSAKGYIYLMNTCTYQLELIDVGTLALRAVMDDGIGNLYVGHQLRYGMSVINLNSGEVVNYRYSADDAQSIPGNNVRCIYQDHLKNIWVGTNMGLALFDPESGKFQRVRHRDEATNVHHLGRLDFGSNVFDIVEMPGNQLWIACDMGGISTVDLGSITPGKPIYYSSTQEVSLSSANTRCIERDVFGNIWVGNYATGVDFIAAQKADFKVLSDYDNEHQQKRIYGVAADQKGNIWLGGEGELQSLTDGSITSSWDLRKVMHRDLSYVTCIMADSRDNVWMGVEDDGVIRLDAQTHIVEHLDIGYPVADIRSFYEDQQGRVWIGSEFGIYIYEDGKITRPEKLNNTLGKVVTFSMLEYGDLMLMGTNAKGLYIIDPDTGEGDSITVADGLPSPNINHMVLDHQKGLWMATTEGLCQIPDLHNPRQFKVFAGGQGLNDINIRALQIDRSGRIWLSTYSGIACFDRGKEKFYNYDYAGSFHLGSFIAGSAATTPDGTMYFGSPTGVCYFNPQMQQTGARVSDVRIVSFEAYNPTGNDAEILYLQPDASGRLHTTWRQNTLRISFAVKDYAQIEDVEYSYMMKGMNSIWYYIAGDHDVVFRGLRPGDYTFILRAKLRNQDWDQASTTQLDILIAPPVWRTSWAYIIYLLIAFAIVSYLIQLYKKKLQLQNSLELERRESQGRQQLNEERLRFFTNITHELRTPLTLILGPLEDLAGNKKIPAETLKKIQLINKSAGRLRNLINEILEFRKTETQNRRLTVAKGDIGALVSEIGQHFKEMNRNERTTINLAIPDDLPPVYFDSEVITTILNNFLSNALKYTAEGVITLSAGQNGQTLGISVSDTGYGIEKEALPHIFDRYYQAKGKHQASGTGIGLALVKSLAELHEGTLGVQSEPDKGSTFTFSLLIDNTYPNALHKEDKETKSESVAGDEADDPQLDARPSLLVVEDNDDIRQYIADSMGDDFHIILAANGREGVDAAMSQMPDIIVSDIMMPVMDGIELTRKLKGDLRTSHIPIILLTAKDSIEDKEEGYDSGADSYLTKPFSARLLLSRINNLLHTRRLLAEIITSGTRIAEVSDETPKLNRLDQEFIDKLNHVIDENVATKDLDMGFMTDRMAMSHSTFYRKIKALTGLTANEYIRKRRLQRCAEMLRSKDYNVTEAATLTGFNDLGYFRDVFKREFGVSPSDYAKGHV